MENVHFGHTGERRAAVFLESQGYTILERNYRTRLGEIDIVARDQDVLCFIEVKTRLSVDYGHPFEAVTPSKQRTVRRLASCYLLDHDIAHQSVRFDVVGILHEPGQEPVIELLKDAF